MKLIILEEFLKRAFDICRLVYFSAEEKEPHVAVDPLQFRDVSCEWHLSSKPCSDIQQAWCGENVNEILPNLQEHIWIESKSYVIFFLIYWVFSAYINLLPAQKKAKKKYDSLIQSFFKNLLNTHYVLYSIPCSRNKKLNGA